ncbi:uncharacterized protein LOC112538971 [Tetranychus urticae]|uniref:uncharacterized protein LOC112538971 n=1 Tax=Tetranychus urticae TaxID=32264 RepID=UPI000D64D718|nr:uncharacterized protein LOC112538971 [Tetranychus urticae]
MSYYHLITILSLALLNRTSHPFSATKHNIISYYKTVNNVFLTNPENHTTSYGETTVDIPSSVANVYDIVKWKVVNVDEDRLMFVHKNKPQILVDQKRIKKMEYFGDLSDSVISLGDNAILHVPTIFNPELTEPVHKCNYIVLLYFDAENESVRVIDSLPWLKDDDWKLIKEWKMSNYIHFDNKLFLLILRSIWNEKAAKVTQDTSIICAELPSYLDCVMYGFLFNCVWSQETPIPPKCLYDDQPKDKTALTVNHCFKIRHFSSSTIINSIVQQTLSIQLDTDQYVRESDKTLTIQAGSDNYCTNITEHLMLNGLNDYNNKPQIVIDQKTIEDMEFSGELSDSIIAFGDNEASHFPSIFNPELTEPSYQWNYLELLYFDVKSAKVSVIRFLFWLKDEDCKLIKKWKMADYIHCDIKLSLLIKRSIWNEKAANVTQEISIIQLCINQGSELISSAVEVQHSNPEFQNSQITEATFKLLDLGFSYSSVSKSKLTSSGNRYYDFEHIDALNQQ